MEPEPAPKLRALASGTYFIKTKAGQRGPFTPEQLLVFVETGKIPLELEVYQEETGLAFNVSDLVG